MFAEPEEEWHSSSFKPQIIFLLCSLIYLQTYIEILYTDGINDLFLNSAWTLLGSLLVMHSAVCARQSGEVPERSTAVKWLQH